MPSERALYIAEPYDGIPFLEYPTRSRFAQLYEAFMPNGKLASTPLKSLVNVDELHIFIQTWLFFGLLGEVFGQDATASKFVMQTDDGARRINTQCLPELADGLVRALRGNTTRQAARAHHMSACLTLAADIFNSARIHFCIDSALLCSVASVADTISEIMDFMQYGHDLAHRATFRKGSWRMACDTEEVGKIMIRNGWCGTDVRQWRDEVPRFQPLYYISKMKQPELKDHSECEGDVCTASWHSSSASACLHRCSDGACGMVSIDDEKIKSILAEGYIGLLRMPDLHCEESFRIDVVSSKDFPRYIALSHVWADGLGNPDANTLPLCQLRHIQSILHGIKRTGIPDSDETLLWLDTLCCPVGSPEHRNICLLRMTQIYRNACVVLILDAALMAYSHKQLDKIEIAFRLLYSTWMRRLWTLQESVLASKIYIQLADGSLDLESIRDVLRDGVKHSVMHASLFEVLYSKMLEISGVFREYAYRHPPIELQRVFDATRGRAVSVATDEPLCLSTHIGLTQNSIISAPIKLRMEAFWAAMSDHGKEIPSTILFHSGSRLVTPGFRWAPASLLGSIRSPFRWQKGDPVARLTSSGLHVQFPGWEFRSRPLHGKPSSLILNAVETYLAELDYSVVRVRQGRWFWLYADPLRARRHPLLFMRQASEPLALLRGTDSRWEKDSDSGSFGFPGICGRACSDGDTLLHFRTHVAVSATKCDQYDTKWFDLAWHMAEDQKLIDLIAQEHDGSSLEEPLMPNDKLLSLIPNPVILYMRMQWDVLEQGPGGRAFFEGHTEFCRVLTFACIILIHTKVCQEVIHEWPETQEWCVD